MVLECALLQKILFKDTCHLFIVEKRLFYVCISVIKDIADLSLDNVVDVFTSVPIK